MKNKTPLRKDLKLILGRCTNKGCWSRGALRADLKAWDKQERPLATVRQLLCNKHIDEQVNSFNKVDHEVAVETKSGLVFRWFQRGSKS